jgi:hypothetical protein
MHIEKSPLLKLDKSQVIGFLKSSGSRDPDVLHTHKAQILSAAKFPKLVGVYLMVLGGLCTILILLAPIGIPLLGFGYWMRRRGVNNLKAVDAGYAEYVGASAA